MKNDKISITEFSQLRNIDRTAVSQWIRRHEDVLKDCQIIGKDRYISIDSDGYRLLEEQYPLPAPVQVINRDPDDIAEISRLNKINEDLNAKMQLLQDQIKQYLIEKAEYARIEAQADSLKLLADENEKRAEKAEFRADKAEKDLRETSEKEIRAQIEAEELRKRLSETEIREKEARDQTDRLLNRGLIDRILNKRP